MGFNDAAGIKKGSPVSYQEGGPRDVLQGISKAFHNSQKAKREEMTSLFQPAVFYTSYVKRFLKKPLAITQPYYSDSVFLKQEDAMVFLPYFLKRLTEKGLIPKEVIDEDGKVDEEKIQVGLAPLTLTFAERSDD
jgi:hypothetical protein